MRNEEYLSFLTPNSSLNKGDNYEKDNLYNALHDGGFIFTLFMRKSRRK